MNYNVQKIIQSELDSGETLIWAGIPKQGIVFRASDVFMIPFSLLWGGFAIVWEVMAITIPSKAGVVDILFPLFGIPFVVMGLHMIFGRFILDSKKRLKTFYGLTDQRAIIVSGLYSKGVKSLNLRSLSDVSLSEKADKSGNITFGQESAHSSFFGANSFPGMNGSSTPKFELIENAKSVYNQLRAQQRS